MSIKPKFLATGIGSMPFTDVEHAIDVSLATLKDAPIWPQLPKFGLHEQMEIQYSEGIPGAVSGGNGRMSLRTCGGLSSGRVLMPGRNYSRTAEAHGKQNCLR